MSTIGKIEKSEFVMKTEQPVPYFFKFLRGSTNGIIVKDELWFICHVVSYEDRRYYYHIVVVLDPTTYALKRYTPLFTFEGLQVEYTLGFVYLDESDELLIGYSVYDSSCKYLQLARTIFEDDMITF
jgi:hypothetical protein